MKICTLGSRTELSGYPDNIGGSWYIVPYYSGDSDVFRAIFIKNSRIFIANTIEIASIIMLFARLCTMNGRKCRDAPTFSCRWSSDIRNLKTKRDEFDYP